MDNSIWLVLILELLVRSSRICYRFYYDNFNVMLSEEWLHRSCSTTLRPSSSAHYFEYFKQFTPWKHRQLLTLFIFIKAASCNTTPFLIYGLFSTDSSTFSFTNVFSSEIVGYNISSPETWCMVDEQWERSVGTLLVHKMSALACNIYVGNHKLQRKIHDGASVSCCMFLNSEIGATNIVFISPEQQYYV